VLPAKNLEFGVASMLKKLSGVILWLLIWGILALGCSPARQAEHVGFSGFLEDYSMLNPGTADGFLYIYRNPHAAWISYDKIFLDQVLIQQNFRSRDRPASMVDLQQAANRFYLALYRELSRDYELVDNPGQGTLVIQTALTDVERSSLQAEAFAEVFPPALFISAGTEFVTGKPIFVSGVSFEGRISDGLNGDLLAAGVDRRVGGKTFKGAMDSWSDIHDSLDLWSRTIRFRLCQWSCREECLDSNK
jgi:hypothetical protein